MKFEPTRYDLGAERYLATGEVLPDSVLEEIRAHDAILLGAVGGRRATRTCRRASSSAACCCGCASRSTTTSTCGPRGSTPASRRPLADPGEVDFVVVREGTEGPYTGNGGALRVGTPAEIATEVSVNTAFGVERVVRDAFARAQTRPRKKLTLVHKTNVLVNAGAVWWRLVAGGRPRSSPTSPSTTCTSTPR